MPSLDKDIVLIGELDETARRVATMPHWRMVRGQWAYEVGPGETMWSIAHDLFGSGLRWRDLWLAQSSSYRAKRDPSRLVVGDILAMPDDAIRRARVTSMFLTGRIHGLGDNGASEAGGDSGYDIPTIGPIGPQSPPTYSGSESGGGGAVHDTQDPNSPSYVKPVSPSPSPAPSGPPRAMISSSALPIVLGAVAVTGVIGAVVYFATR